ncbi:hypothetical protein HRbin17_00092 [bacterium HR17]|uniref:Uncharacterized protein n=1 Tax=Candidatus Fervidibacter japonicus TaxID=2035412 RepID=A0A2H5X8X7_9BACT|nr:hypothetical protein HRbin17_00092 [bacterium HR17]
MRRLLFGGSESRPPNAPSTFGGRISRCAACFSAARRAALRTHLQHSEGASPDAPLAFRRLGEPPSERTSTLGGRIS